MNAPWLSIVLSLALAQTVATRQPPAEQAADCVILIHGMGRSAMSMMILQWRLRRAGFQVINLRYPTRRSDFLEVAARRLDQAIARANSSKPGQIHFVTHSLGGIVTRDYLASHSITNLGRVVMLAPPNHGSELADFFKQSALGRLILGPAGRQLGTASSDLPVRLGPARFHLGVIASEGPGISWNPRVFHGPNDGLVSVESAKLEGMDDFLVVHGTHTFVMNRPDVTRAVIAFLRHGSFSPPRT